MPASSNLVPQRPLVPRPDSIEAVRQTVGLLTRMGYDPQDTWPDDAVVALQCEHADECQRSLIQFTRDCAVAGGYDRRAVAGPREAIRAAMSVMQFADAWSSALGAVIINSFGTEADTTRNWTVDGECKTFRPESRIGLGAGGALGALPRGGQAELATAPSESTATQKLRRYARRIELDEEDIIDDNLGIYQKMAEDAGRAAARLRPDLSYSILAANPTMPDGTALFDSDHSNTATDALSSSGVAAGVKAMGVQQVDGIDLHISPDVLIVPPSLEVDARSIAESSAANPRLKVVVEPRIENGVTDPATGTAYSGSSTAWYLARSNTRTIEVGYPVNEPQTPQSHEYALKPGQWGLGLVTWLDIGAVALDWRALYRGNI